MSSTADRDPVHASITAAVSAIKSNMLALRMQPGDKNGAAAAGSGPC